MDAEARSLIGQVLDKGRLKLIDLIGTGSFAAVFLAEDILSPYRGRYAVKCLFKHGLDSRQLATQRREASFLRRLHAHPNIIRLYKTIETPRYLFLVMEYCELDLYDAITQQNGFPEDVVKEVFGQLIDALMYSHERGVYHRDLKPENILISRDYRVKLADFGLATTDEWSTELGCGSVRYMGPECLSTQSPALLSKYGLYVDDSNDHQYNSSSKTRGYCTAANDVWSLGVILTNLLFGKNPWHEASLSDPIFSAYVQHNPNILRQQFNLTPQADAIFRKVFAVDPRQRCSLAELKYMVDHVPAFVMTSSIFDEDDFPIILSTPVEQQQQPQQPPQKLQPYPDQIVPAKRHTLDTDNDSSQSESCSQHHSRQTRQQQRSRPRPRPLVSVSIPVSPSNSDSLAEAARDSGFSSENDTDSDTDSDVDSLVDLRTRSDYTYTQAAEDDDDTPPEVSSDFENDDDDYDDDEGEVSFSPRTPRGAIVSPYVFITPSPNGGGACNVNMQVVDPTGFAAPSPISPAATPTSEDRPPRFFAGNMGLNPLKGLVVGAPGVFAAEA
ncbi:hypothetical protein HK102_003133 [Quaeritorhiza haematococci]|nr:hypothetical protein HK102_003133 [Quaeritorhiza haematococci]